MKTYQITLPPDLEQFVEEQLVQGVWGKPDILIAYALAAIRAQFEKAKQDGTAQLLAQLRSQIAAAQAKQAETDELLGGMMGGVPIDHEHNASTDPVKDLNEFLKKIQQQIAATNRGGRPS